MFDGLHIDLAAQKVFLKLAGGQEQRFRQVFQYLGMQTHL